MTLKEKCIEAIGGIIQERILIAKTAMEQAQESANSEGKSSAGDKYETGRAMAQNTRDMYAKQLLQAENDLAFYEKYKFTGSTNYTSNGSLIETNQGLFYLGLSLGRIKVDNTEIVVISEATPIGQLLIGKKVTDHIIFHNKNYNILNIS